MGTRIRHAQIIECKLQNADGKLIAERTLGVEREFVRLETAWRRDFVSGMKSLVIGDAIGSSGLWGRPVRFGGLSYGTNFATNPGFVTFPLPSLAGEAALPTTTEPEACSGYSFLAAHAFAASVTEIT